MAKRKATRASRSARPGRKASAATRSGKRPTAAKRQAKKKAGARRTKPKPRATAKSPAKAKAAKAKVRSPKSKTIRPVTKKRASASGNAGGTTLPRPARLDRARRTLADQDPVTGPPSSLDMDRRGSAARTGRAEIAENLANHRGMTGVTGGDPDVDIEDAYFGGDEAPGGDNPTPDQDIVDDIGKALGVEYEDSEELKASEKVVERDKHRWELDPASSEDYKDRK